LAESESRGDQIDRVVTTLRSNVEAHENADRTSRLAALAEFAAGAGHELNNPLAVVMGRAQLLLARVDNAEDVRALRVIIGQAQRAHRIIRDLMYIARPPAPRPRPCRPDDIAKATIRDLRQEADARGIALSVETREPGHVAWTDPDPIRHLLDVLVRNAIESTSSGGTVRIQTGRTADALTWVVRDSGRGYTVEEGHHLFEPFFCGRQAGRGLGLGLPRAARFLELMGGEITCRSTPGQGATFAVRLPLESFQGEPIANRWAAPSTRP
jgi:signal transduction histidine kinase